MNREEKIHLEIIEGWHRDARRAEIKLLALFFLGCVAIIVGLYCWDKYMVEHKPVPTMYCNKQTYNGHHYLFLSTNNPGQKGVVHDPDCVCHNVSEKRQNISVQQKKNEGTRYIIMPTVNESSKGMEPISAR